MRALLIGGGVDFAEFEKYLLAGERYHSHHHWNLGDMITYLMDYLNKEFLGMEIKDGKVCVNFAGFSLKGLHYSDTIVNGLSLEFIDNNCIS